MDWSQNYFELQRKKKIKQQLTYKEQHQIENDGTETSQNPK